MRKIFLSIVVLCFCLSLNAQISTNEQPVSYTMDIAAKSIDTKTMPALDLAILEKENLRDDDDKKPFRFGFAHQVNYNLHNSGTWQQLPDGSKLWQLNIICPEALSINLLYDKFWIPEGGKFFIYTPDKKNSLGAFTSANNKEGARGQRGFATGLLDGDSIVLEYYQPKEVKDDAILSISAVVHGYRKVDFRTGTLPDGFGTSESCNINVNCSQGQDWQNEKRAVARVLVDGTEWGSGALINSTANTNSSLFLTADHLLDTGGYDATGSYNLDNFIFYWNYESSGCSNPSSEPTLYSTSGATLLANSSDSDFALFKLDEDPFIYSPYYLGWDRSGSSGTGGVCIHHPSGDIKKISTYTITPQNVSVSGKPCYYWGITWSLGVTYGGSSGSPLLNSSHRVIGHQRGGYSTCSDPSKVDNFGKFSISWTGNGNSDYRRRLNYWLDPSATTSQTMDGASFPISISGLNVIANSATYNVSYLPTGYTVTWSLSDSYYNSYCLQQDYPASNQCTISRVSGHDMYNATLTAAIKRNGTTVKTITKTGIYAYSGFYGTYYNGQTSHQINLPNPLYVLPNTLVIINSPNLVNASVSYSGETPTNWIFSPNNGTLKVGMSSTIGSTVNVHVVCENGSTYDLPIVVTNNLNLLSVVVSDGQIEVTISPESCSDQTDLNTEDLIWTLEVYNATTTEKVFTKTVRGGSFIIDTTGWKPGVYVVKVTIGKEVYSKKVIVK